LEKVCLDTNVIIQFMKNDGQVVSRLEDLAKTHVLVTTVLNSFELYGGIYRKNAHREEKDAEQILEKMEVIEFAKEDSKPAAKIFSDLIRQGKESSPEDSIIAALCLKNKCKLFTLNRKHFEKIPGLQIV